MPLPRISGVLNNCPLHVLTPELRTEINLLANGRSTLRREFIPTYDLLKKKFAQFYKIPAENWSWQAFDAMLTRHNDFDLQMILGPVLRVVMNNMMGKDLPNVELALYADDDAASNNYNMNLPGFIQHKTQILQDGRYASLSPDEVFVFLASHFGLSMKIHKEGTILEFPNDPQQKPLFVGRPCVEMFHQGGVAGAGAGGHFERTETAEERIDYEHAGDVHLRIVAEFFKLDSPDITRVAIDLLRLYMKTSVHALSNGDDATSEMFHTFHLTVAQIEKFLYNRLYVSEQNAKEFLGNLTLETTQLIDRIPLLEEMDYDEGIHTLLSEQVDPSDPPIKRAPFSRQQYEIALTLLTPPVPQRQAHRYRISTELSSEGLWALRANEISGLQSLTNEYAEKIIFDYGLSVPLYELCNRPEIAQELLPEFLNLLAADPHFEEKSSEALKQVVANRPLLPPSPVSDRPKNRTALRFPTQEDGALFPNLSNSPVRASHTPYPHTPECNMYGIYGTESVAGVEADSNRYFDMNEVMMGEGYHPPTSPNGTPLPYHDSEINTCSTAKKLTYDEASLQPLMYEKRQSPPSAANTYFWLRAIQACLAIGGVCAVIAVITCPPVAAALGLSTVLGVAVSDVAITATFVAGSSVLLAASFFAVKQLMDDPVIPPPTLRFGGVS